ncbi:MAG TPA: hypothetical protein VH593_05500 [Ktedonobacteraceae bacterium]
MSVFSIAQKTPVLSARELPPTFVRHIEQVEGACYDCTINNHEPFVASLYHASVGRTEPVHDHNRQHTAYIARFWTDSPLLIEYRGQCYCFDAAFVAEELRG